ncbi:hypothetical protein POX_b02706 [Penicillium oxalicum]|uniref:hypothetical protein n=1 Tax=Penicillium oxalicum TaxID=69781 RepID=UPI0020B6ACBE|nr:hypothetical protein POX_b02706 [Penicillium oxalicum]KAI2792666.1 hypothetical protein POX_b02706 [Penicillium oxalicum]
MPKIKDGLMACTLAEQTTYLNEILQRRKYCLDLLASHEQNHPDALWNPSEDRQGPEREPISIPDRANLKLATRITFDAKQKIIWPPKFTRLSDELVYMATKFLKASERTLKYPYDFNDRGDIREKRVPSGVSPLNWAHGLPFFPVFKGYYILCGREHAKWIGWLLNPRLHRIMMAYSMWTIGPVVAPGSAVRLQRTVERQMRVHKPLCAKDVERRWEKAESARDVVSMAHNDLSIVPETQSGGYVLFPICRLDGYHVRCGPDSMHGKGVEVGKRWLLQCGVTNFDYDKSLRSPYSNQSNPAAFGIKHELSNERQHGKVIGDATGEMSRVESDDGQFPICPTNEPSAQDESRTMKHLTKKRKASTSFDAAIENPERAHKRNDHAGKVFTPTGTDKTTIKQEPPIKTEQISTNIETTKSETTAITTTTKNQERTQSFNADVAAGRLTQMVTTLSTRNTQTPGSSDNENSNQTSSEILISSDMNEEQALEEALIQGAIEDSAVEALRVAAAVEPGHVLRISALLNPTSPSSEQSELEQIEYFNRLIGGSAYRDDEEDEDGLGDEEESSMVEKHDANPDESTDCAGKQGNFDQDIDKFAD